LWVNASNAIPGVLPPVPAGGHVLVDGGILNNEPGDLLKEVCGGQVIVSSVRAKKDLTVDEAHTEMPSSLRVLWSRLNPFEKSIRVPGISDTIIRTLMVGSDRRARYMELGADYYLRPPTDRFRLDAFSKVEEIAEAGYQYAREQILTWKEENRLPGSPPATGPTQFP
jgi:predicted acylesterase/phospholipase RssA